MKRKIRRGVFETNSSSVHSITMCSSEEYGKWMNGEMVYDNYDGVLVSKTDDVLEEIELNDERYITVEQYNDFYDGYEQFEKSYTTSSGENVVAFGYYGQEY